MSADMKSVQKSVIELEGHIERFVTACATAGAYMPGLATRLRIYADELADRFPDDTNGGRQD